jgi:hypothetical protein
MKSKVQKSKIKNILIVKLVCFSFTYFQIGVIWAVDSEKEEKKANEIQIQQELKPEQLNQQYPPYMFMPPVYNTLDMFQKALDAMDTKIGFSKKEEPRVKISGYFHTRFRSMLDANEFSMVRARGKMHGNIVDYISYQLMLDAVSEKVLKDAFVDFNFYPFLKFRIGQFKVPFGSEGVEEVTQIKTINRSLVTTNLYQYRDIGIEAMGENKRFKYGIGIFNGSGENSGDRDNYKDIIGRFGWYLQDSFTIGMSGHYGKFYNNLDKEYQEKYRAGIDVDYSDKYFHIQGEYIYGENNTVTQISGKASGWYILFSSRYFYPYEPLIRYEYYSSNTTVKQTTIGINYYFIADIRLMLNYEMRNLLSGDNTFLAQLQVVF